MAPASIATVPPAGHNPLRIQLLGSFHVTYGDHVVDDNQWRLSKARSLVKLLALSPSYRLHREQVLEHLWPEMDPEAALNNLHQALFAARRTLAAVVPGIDGRLLIVLQRQELALQPPNGVWVDADAFEQQATGALQADDPAASYAAVELYGGELLPGDLYEDWAVERREALRDQYLTLLQRLAQQHEERGEHAPAVDMLRRLIAAEPALEAAHTGLMRVYALTGRRQQALRQYARLQEILAREFDAEPDPATDQLYRAILDHRFPAPNDIASPARPAPPPAATPPPAAEPAPPVALIAPPSDFVNRVREVDIVRAAFGQAAAGQGQIVLLTGDPGIGKTRTASEAAAAARAAGMRMLWGRCYEGEGAPAWWPWVQIIRANLSASDPAALRAEMGPGAADIARIVPEVRQLLPDLPEPPPLDPDQERFRLFDSVTRYLTALAAAQPLLLVLDDLHWADRSSLLLLEFLAEEVARARICLLGTYRDADVDRHHPLSRTLAQLSRSPATQRVDLAGLGIEDVARYSALAAGSAPPRGLAAAIWEQTEGNPFFMGEVVRLLRDEGRLEQAEEVRSWRLTIPPGVRETVGLRLDRLSAEANQALTIAAITGREFALSVLERASDLPQARVLAALEEALAAGIIDEVQDAPGRFRFSHLLIRQTLYEEVSNARRVYVHRQIGEALERVHAANLEPVLAELAYHFNLAAPLGDVGRAIEYATLAGAQAMDRVAWADAVGHYERALGLLQAHAPAEERRRCELLLSLGEAQKNAGDTVEARETFERAAGIARSIEAPEHFARAALGIAEAGFYSEFWYEDLARPLDEARAMLGREPSPLRVRLLSRLAHMLGDSPDSLDRRRALCEEAVEIARMIDDPGVLAYALYARVVALATPENLDERIADASEIIRLAEAAGDQQLALLGHAWQVFDHLEVGDLPAVDEEIEAYARAANALRQPQTEWGLRVRRTMRLLMEGQFDEAERLAHEALVLGRQSMAWPATAAHVLQLFVIRREQGRLPEIEAAISGLVREYPGIPSWRCLLAELYAETGRDADARSAFEQLAQRDFGDIPRDIYWLANMAILAEVCATLEDERWAALLYHMLLPFAGRIISPGTNAICLGPTDFYLGILATTLRDWDAVDAHLAAATRQSDQLGMRPALARAQYAHAAMFATRGAADDLLQAAAFASAAREIAAELQMVQVAAQVDRLIGRIESAEM